VAGAFVYPVGDELDYTKGRSGEGGGFYVSDEYLATRGRKKKRIHRGVDLANGRAGAEVRSIASGVVVVADASALIKYKKRQKIKVPKVVNGKRTYVNGTRLRTGYKWRTGWGNYVVVRHRLPDGKTIHSLYAHLAPKSVSVKRGEVVSAGQPLGKVGRTGRASSAHLHLEIRKALPEGREVVAVSADGEAEDGSEVGGAEVAGSQDPEGVEDEPTVEERSFARIATVDPMAFLESHVRRYEDLEPGTWQARYALAATRDGLLPIDRDRFEPESEISRADYYRALVTAFRLASPFTKDEFSSSVDALVDAGILDSASARDQRGRDGIGRDDALEILLRCLDRGAARARTLGAIKPDALALDFNRQFAGREAAEKAVADAKAKSDADYRDRKKKAEAERARLAKAAKAAKAKGKKVRVKVPVVKPTTPVPLLDAGFEALAKSTRKLTRAESCLLLASALRVKNDKLSALQRAAAKVPTAG
jgi:murein DD-endopeptidase MepM/ murein hydrolase activator NlpD